MRRSVIAGFFLSCVPALALAQPAPALSPGIQVEKTPATEPTATELSPWSPGSSAAEPATAPAETSAAPSAEPPPAGPTPASSAAPPADGGASTSAASPGPSDGKTDPLAPAVGPKHRISYMSTLVLRVNPLGLEERLSFMYHRRLFARTGKLFADNFIGLGLTPTFSPSITRLGATLQLVPLAILSLRAGYYFIGYYGSHGFKAHPFSSPNADYGPEVIGARADAKQGLTTYGGQAELAALFQLKFGPVALRNEATFFHYNVRLPAGSDVFYDLRTDMLAPGRGWLLSNESDLLYINTKIRLTAGVRATYVHAFYPDALFEPGEMGARNANDSARLGPLIAYTFRDRPERRFMKPTLFLLAQWWVKHRFRTGQDVSQALPMLVLGFSFTGDLWRRP